uniref:Mitochondrial inner membrane protease ATP23 n=1 Tax=Sphenodon punctatus TaxID=8508 RepID=A0A8D0GTM0_SPHPU
MELRRSDGFSADCGCQLQTLVGLPVFPGPHHARSPPWLDLPQDHGPVKVRIICNGIFLVNVCNNIHHPSIMNRVVTHELIHAFDHCRAHVDWFRNIKHLACSEIRAANLSGDCSFINEVRRFKFGFKQHRQACIRDGAIRSILAVRKVDRETAEKAVDEVFNSCFNDHEPYGRVPHNSKEAKYAYRDFQNRDRYYANL